MTLLTLLVVLYLAFLVAFGSRGGRPGESLGSFLTAGGAAGALVCALSLTSTIIGGSATLGMGALAQRIGPAAFWWLGVGAIGLVLHGLLVAPVVRALPAVTLPEVLRVLVGPAAERWAGAIIALSWTAITAAQFTALHALLGSISGGMTAEVLYGLLAAGIVLHTAAGGQRGVLRADALHAALLLGGFSAAALWCLAERPAAVAALPVLPAPGTFGLADWAKMMLLVGLTYVAGPDMFSRTFAARDGRTARRAAWAAAPMVALFGVIVTLLALLNLDAKQPVSDWLGAESPLPPAVAAALAMGLISALAGSADTILLSAAGIVERDLLRGTRTGAVRLWAAAIGTAAALAVWMSGDIIGWLLKGYALFVPGVCAPLLVLVTGRARRADPALWTAGAVTGGLLGLAGALLNETAFTLAGMAVSALAAAAAVRRAAGAAGSRTSAAADPALRA